MKESYLKLLKDYFTQAIETISGIDFYEEVVNDIEDQKENKALPIYNELKKQLEDQEYVGKLTIQEQHSLGRNEINFRKLLQEMDETLSNLMVHKWSQNVRLALWIMEEAKLLLEYVITGGYEDIEEDGIIVKAKQLIDTKKFQKHDYAGKIAACQTMLNIITEILNEGNLDGHVKFALTSAIGKSIMLLQREMEDREVNGPPELFTFDFPKLEEPEVPDEVEEEKVPEAEQQELPLEVVK